MSHTTTCTRCGRGFEATSEDDANRPAWLGNRLCPDCWELEHRGACIRGELDAGRLPDPADLDAQVEHIEREGRAALVDLRALAGPTAGYTIVAACFLSRVRGGAFLDSVGDTPHRALIMPRIAATELIRFACCRARRWRS